ncbi:cytochrome P450 52E1 [Magnaporthiopsis poae ATCC 64411]|uniref:Cytochrome P450 52E1 n=1 Tax=Magnaporthiopsis poae (strain ATCC 64411 / 73-15) TaxID=644358 RepID=A0A0C4DQS0_MAGP6|nr:cytochrome P450 52E1 [Magnaporthiopsis poae ATCC 64411]
MMTMDSSTDFMLGRSTGLLVRGGSSSTTEAATEFLEAFDYCSWKGAHRARLGMLMALVPDARYEAGVKTIREYVREYVAGAMAVREQQEQEDKKNKAMAGSGAVDGKQQHDGEKKSYVFLHELVDSGADEEYVLDQVLSIILAGRDTTAAGLSGAFYFLARAPEAVKKLRAEIEDLGVKNPTWEQLRGMKYLQNVIRETLRLYPPVGTNSRNAVRDTVLPRGGGPDGKLPLLVPKGTNCRYVTYTMHRRQDIYGPDAEEFRPERWDDLRVSWEYLPFSGGPRICIGQQFALTQMSYVLFRIMQNFESLEPVGSGPLLTKVGITLLMMDGCKVKMTPVRDAK